MKKSKTLFLTLVIFPFFLCENSYALVLEEEIPPIENFIDPGLSLMGDVFLKDNNIVAAILKIFSSLYDMHNKEKSFLDEGERRFSTISDLIRTASYLSLCRSNRTSEMKIFSKKFLGVAALRMLATFSSWYAGKMHSKEHRGLAKILGSVSRAVADCITGNKLVLLASLFSAGVDTYTTVKTVCPEWGKKLQEEWKDKEQFRLAEPLSITEIDATRTASGQHGLLEFEETVSDDKEDEPEQEECWICRYKKAKKEFIACENCGKKACKECLEKWVNTTDYDLYKHSNETNGEDMQYKIYEKDKTAYKGCPFCRGDSEVFKAYRK